MISFIYEKFNLCSVNNFILFILDHVIGISCPFVMSILDHLMHMNCCFILIQTSSIPFNSKSLLQSLKCYLLEARKARVNHKFHQVIKVSIMLSNSQKSLDSLLNKQLIRFSLSRSSKNFNKLLGKLEISRFKVHVLSWAPIENKSEVNMN